MVLFVTISKFLSSFFWTFSVLIFLHIFPVSFIAYAWGIHITLGLEWRGVRLALTYFPGLGLVFLKVKFGLYMCTTLKMNCMDFQKDFVPGKTAGWRNKRIREQAWNTKSFNEFLRFEKKPKWVKDDTMLLLIPGVIKIKRAFSSHNEGHLGSCNKLNDTLLIQKKK